MALSIEYPTYSKEYMFFSGFLILPGFVACNCEFLEWSPRSTENPKDLSTSRFSTSSSSYPSDNFCRLTIGAYPVAQDWLIDELSQAFLDLETMNSK